MTDTEALDIFRAGQAFLEALYPHLSDRGLETFDRSLSNLYEHAGLAHRECDVCDADTPEQLLKDDECPKCYVPR